MFRTSRKDEVFYSMFVETMQKSCKATELLFNMMKNFTDIKQKIAEIENLEHECDQCLHMIFEQLNKSFITPIDREDIFLIAKEIDNITDNVEAVAHRFLMLNITNIQKNAIRLAELAVACAKELNFVIAELKNMKKSKLLKDKIIEVNRIENEADEIFRSAITELFIYEKDPIEAIKWKEIYEYLENTIDACEDVANIIEGVVMKNA